MKKHMSLILAGLMVTTSAFAGDGDGKKETETMCVTLIKAKDDNTLQGVMGKYTAYKDGIIASGGFGVSGNRFIGTAQLTGKEVNGVPLQLDALNIDFSNNYSTIDIVRPALHFEDGSSSLTTGVGVGFYSDRTKGAGVGGSNPHIFGEFVLSPVDAFKLKAAARGGYIYRMVDNGKTMANGGKYQKGKGSQQLIKLGVDVKLGQKLTLSGEAVYNKEQ